MTTKREAHIDFSFLKFKKLQKTKGRPAIEIPIWGLYAKVAHSKPIPIAFLFLQLKWAENNKTIPRKATKEINSLFIQYAVNKGSQ